jgi:hypothetical protein
LYISAEDDSFFKAFGYLLPTTTEDPLSTLGKNSYLQNI